MKRWQKIVLWILGVMVASIAIYVLVRTVNKAHTAQREVITEEARSLSYAKLFSMLNQEALEQSQIPGITIEKIDNGMLSGYSFVPEHITSSNAVIVLGGSEGSCNPALAAEIAQQGYKVYAFYYFGAAHTEPELTHVPLELFKHMVDYVRTDDSHAHVHVIAASKGSEFALRAAAEYPDLVNTLILFAPSAYVFQGLSRTFDEVSSFSYQGQDVAFLSFRKADARSFISLMQMLVGLPVSYGDVYDSLISQADTREAARIKVESINAKIVLFAGSDDRMWPSQRMAELIAQYNPKAEVHVFAEAGHIFFGPSVVHGIEVGGKPSANTQAHKDSMDVVFERIAQ